MWSGFAMPTPKCSPRRQTSKKKPPTYKHYADLLKAQKPEIVIVGTPDHWHALPAIAAIEAGADLYLQKPVGVDIAESKAILAAARKHGRVVQIGTQRRSTEHLIDAKEKIVDAGLLGDVAQAEVCCYYHMRNRKKPEEVKAEVPEHLDWDLWTGPAPMRKYNTVAHPRGWRSFMDYRSSAVRSPGTTPKARSSATTRPTSSSPAPTARPTSIRERRRRSDP